MRVRVWCVGMAIVATAACGKSAEEKKAEDVKKGAEQVQDSAANMAKGLEDMAKGLGALTGNNTDPNMKPVDPVSFRELQSAFGDISGWEKGKPTGERMTMPVNYSEAKITYTKGDSEIEV